MTQEDIEICEELLFTPDDNSLFKFIEHFSDKSVDETRTDEEFEALSDEEKIAKLLLDGDRERMIPLVESAKDRVGADKIVNEILIDAMKVVGELFGSGEMQLPFVLQSAETMKATVDFLNPYLTKKEKDSDTTLLIGTVKGDVHDVGKNLVDIIVSNNGFKVINIGIKTELEQFLEAIEREEIDAIGMSGLLVKSTAVMRDNLEEMERLGINIPVLLGGAALTRGFVDDFCRPIYSGAIFYCRDAFDSVIAMGRIEEWKRDKSRPLDTKLAGDLVEKREKREKRVVEIPPFDKIELPPKVDIPTPPFWGRRVLQKGSIDLELLFEWVNMRSLIKMQWGYKSRGVDREEYQKLLETKVYPIYERLKREFIDGGLLEPTIIYGYYPCRGYDGKLYIFDESRGWNVDENANRESFDEVRDSAVSIFEFPRQRRSPFRAVSDFFRYDRDDVVALTCVSAGAKFSEYEKSLYDAGKYLEYNYVHGLSVELAEALAEMAHKQIRIDLGILGDNEKPTLRDVRVNRYRGARYSFGYPACPDLEQNREIFKLLKPEEFGITLSETFQMHPEQTTTAIVAHHPKANYFAI